MYGGRVFGSATRSSNLGARQRPTAPAAQPIRRDAKKAAETFEPGDKVSHKTFGPGVVTAVKGDTIEVAFTRTGKKKLMKGFAPIVKVD